MIQYHNLRYSPAFCQMRLGIRGFVDSSNNPGTCLLILEGFRGTGYEIEPKGWKIKHTHAHLGAGTPVPKCALGYKECFGVTNSLAGGY